MRTLIAVGGTQKHNRVKLVQAILSVLPSPFNDEEFVRGFIDRDLMLIIDDDVATSITLILNHDQTCRRSPRIEDMNYGFYGYDERPFLGIDLARAHLNYVSVPTRLPKRINLEIFDI